MTLVHINVYMVIVEAWKLTILNDIYANDVKLSIITTGVSIAFYFQSVLNQFTLECLKFELVLFTKPKNKIDY